MMKIRRVVGIVAGLSLLAVCGALIGCGEDYTPPDINSVKITVTGSTDNGHGLTTLTWDAIDGFTFDVYRAETEYSEYILLDEGNTTGEFYDPGRCAYYMVVARNKNGEVVKTFGGNSAANDLISEQELLGRNVYVFSPDDAPLQVNAIIGDGSGGIYARMYDERVAEFTESRYAVMLKGGTYDNSINLKAGYYTTFHGLGLSPEDVSVNSLLCRDGTNGDACINFWRGAENFTVRTNTTWAVSQGASLRAMNIQGNLQFFDKERSSGGFMADSKISGKVISGSQQQWLSRNSKWNNWEGSVWNMCFAGNDGAPTSDASYPNPPYTVEANTTLKEKPFLVFDEENGYRIAVPALRENAVGPSWTGNTARIERYIAMNDILFARAGETTAADINTAIQSGKSVVVTPGIYKFDEPIVVNRDNAIVLGVGLATLRPTGGNAVLKVENCENASIGGLLFDAGNVQNDCLVSIGTETSTTSGINMYDMFFRIGGANEKKTYADTAVKLYADDCTGDNFWIWRADHDLGTGWNDANCTTGMKVYGDNFKAYALMAEHAKGHNVEWYGQNGKVFFYQSEIAYDVPNQAAWMDGDKNGFSSLYVDSGVNTFSAQGLGVYSFFKNSGVELNSAITAPDKQGISIKHACTFSSTDYNGTPVSGIKYVINEIANDSVKNGAKMLTEFTHS